MADSSQSSDRTPVPSADWMARVGVGLPGIPPFSMADAAKELSKASLLTTMLRQADGFFMRDAHIERLRASAAALGRPLDEVELHRLVHGFPWVPALGKTRVRLLVAPDGKPRTEYVTLGDCPSPTSQLPQQRAAGDEHLPYVVLESYPPVARDDPRLQHKTTARSPYDQARARHRVGQPGEALDVMLMNGEGESTLHPPTLHHHPHPQPRPNHNPNPSP